MARCRDQRGRKGCLEGPTLRSRPLHQLLASRAAVPRSLRMAYRARGYPLPGAKAAPAQAVRNLSGARARPKKLPNAGCCEGPGSAHLMSATCFAAAMCWRAIGERQWLRNEVCAWRDDDE